MGDSRAQKNRGKGPSDAETRWRPWLRQLENPNPHPSTILAENLRMAELAAQKVVERTQPTLAADHHRMIVMDYLYRLFRRRLAPELQVFPFGSVPLKTYLPNGDIDLTALCSPDFEDSLAKDIYSVLQSEVENMNSECRVKDIQYIQTKVKIIKCFIQNIPVDISINQIGGLCTLCILEQVDCLIQKDHLFKRSIILIKAWCYYESHILGAQHSLISTYALATLVLYIFNLFHTSLNGPLAVLYRFLDYFSKFDWENYGISLQGPVPLSSLPNISAEAPETDESNVLLNDSTLISCLKTFSASAAGQQAAGQQGIQLCPKKHLNIVDLLKRNNNLGLSVNRANFNRIRSAFAFGAQNLGRILLLPEEQIADEINKFFTHIPERSVNEEKLDIQDFFPSHADGNFSDHHGGVHTTPSDSYGTLCTNFSRFNILSFNREHEIGFQSGWQLPYHNLTANALNMYPNMEPYTYMGANAVPRISNAGSDLSVSSSASSYRPPHDFFYNCGNGTASSGSDLNFPVNLGHTKGPSIQPPGSNGDVTIFLRQGLCEFNSPDGVNFWSPSSHGLPARHEKADTILLDLTGNFVSYHLNLINAICCHNYLSGRVENFIYQFSHPRICKRVRRNAPHWRSGFLPAVSPNSRAHNMQERHEDTRKKNGTGTYVPNKNNPAYNKKPIIRRPEPPAPKNETTAPATCVEATSLEDKNSVKEEAPTEPRQLPEPCIPEAVTLNGQSSPVPEKKLDAVNSTTHSSPVPEKKADSVNSITHSSSEITEKSDRVSPKSPKSGFIQTAAQQKEGANSNIERPLETLQLKDENEFPPLSKQKPCSNCNKFPPTPWPQRRR